MLLRLAFSDFIVALISISLYTMHSFITYVITMMLPERNYTEVYDVRQKLYLLKLLMAIMITIMHNRILYWFLICEYTNKIRI